MSRTLCGCWGKFYEHEEGVPGCETQTKSTTEAERAARKVDVNTPIEEGGRISEVAAELMDTLIKKNSDYAPTTEFSNFEEAAEFAEIEPFELMLAQIGIKMTRIKSLNSSIITDPYNESLRDSLVDLAGYAVIAAAWLDMNGESDG